MGVSVLLCAGNRGDGKRAGIFWKEGRDSEEKDGIKCCSSLVKSPLRGDEVNGLWQ